jgi:hypothetical protein
MRSPTSLFVILLGTLALLVSACSGGHGLGGDPDGSPPPDAGPDASLCGVGDDEKPLAASTRIYNGTTEPEICMSPRQQLAVGALLFQEYAWGNGCTGTLVADDVVLTAAHCVQDWYGNPIHPSQVRFALGEDALDPVAVINVDAVAAHPGYQGDAIHDVGVLLLEVGVSTLSLDVLPIPPNRRDLGSAFVDERVQNVGYGDTESSDDNSRRFWTTEPVTAVRPNEYTVFGGGSPQGSSVCYGDSGGPGLYLFDGNALAVIGTVSWGDPSCMDYDHFARTDDNLTFLETQGGTLDPCAGVDEVGRCDAGVAIWCDAGTLRQRCCLAEGVGCGANALGQQRCLDACGGLTFAGQCDGTDAVWCQEGEIRRRRCAPCAQVCGPTGTAQGRYCIDP